MIRRLDDILESTVRSCMGEGLLKEMPVPDHVIETPNRADHGHFATNLPLAMAKGQRRAPMEIANIIAEHIDRSGNFLSRVEAAPPGFVNFWISPEQWHGVLSDIVAQGKDYGGSERGNGKKVLVEFVSANPTGPLHLGHGRGAAVGDTLCRILSFCGFDVIREFYINDAGRQIQLLGESVYARFMQAANPEYEFPEQGYRGDYIADLAESLSEETALDTLPERDAVETCARMGKKKMLAEIKSDLGRFRVDFDVWYPESELFASGALDKTLADARDKGQLFEQDGALWIRTSEFGDDKDRVIQKSDGQYTYFASDISYHLDKKRRRVDRAINIWGADHHGYIPRVKAALSSFGFPKDWLSVMLIQLVKLFKDGREIKMSKRAGSYVTLNELIDEVGIDAVRFVFLTKSHESPLDFDMDLVTRQDSDNPVYYVQYAHARICSIFRKADQEGLIRQTSEPAPLGRLELDEEMALIRHMAAFPSLVDDIAETLEPHRLTYYLSDLAAGFHRYFNLGNKDPKCRVIAPDREASLARLELARAVRTVVANGLNLLGVSAPERM